MTLGTVCFPQVLEKFTENTRFCIICNYLSKIIPAIQSRCTRFRFGPLTEEKMLVRLEHIIEQEKYQPPAVLSKSKVQQSITYFYRL